MEGGETALLCARVEEYAARAARGDFCYSAFLTPREQVLARRAVPGASLFAWGGYPDAERRRLFFVPDYAGEPERADDAGWLALAELFFADDLSGAVIRLRITGSGYRVLGHRDYLGSLLALGIERTTIGDIVPLDDFSAALFCDGKIASYLCTALERIGSDKVKVVVDDQAEPLPPRATKPLSDTVASPRLDCVVAALANLSREKAQSMIRVGEVEVDFFPETKPDAEVREGALLSLRGFGRYRVLSLGGVTKRGRLRLAAEQFI